MKLRQEINKLEEKLQNIQSQTAHIAEVGGNQWHDNAAYDSLVIDLRGMDKRLSSAHQALNKAVLVDSPKCFNRVAIGTRVKIKRDGEETAWEIAGFGESDPDQNMLAYNTPLASLIMGKLKGEVINSIIAGKHTEIEILEIFKEGDENVRSS